MSHYIVEGVGVTSLSAVFGGWRLFVHCATLLPFYLFARYIWRDIRMDTRPYIRPGHKNTSESRYVGYY